MKNVLTAVAVLMATASVLQAQPSASISIIHHNIHSGGQPQWAADHIIDLMEMTPQKALVLVNEANYARQYFDFNYGGWDNIWPASPHEGRGNAIFSRNAAATKLDSWVLTMQEPWKHNILKDPRVYPVMKCELTNNPWAKFFTIDVHFPTNKVPQFNQAARQESVDRLIAFSDAHPDLPLIICGDFNMGENEVRQRIANQIGGRLYSDASVDHIIVRDGANVSIEDVVVNKLGLLGSDHHAIRYNFTFNLHELVVDNSDSGFSASGSWSTGTSAADKYGTNYRFRATGSVSDPATWSFDVPAAGDYEIFAWWSQGANRSITAPYILPDSSTVNINQQTGGGAWQSLGIRNLSAGSNDVKLSCWTSNGTVVIGDAVKLVPQ